VKSLLKHGLKMAELGPACLTLLAAICGKKYRGGEGDFAEQQLIADMIESHSGTGYLSFVVTLTSRISFQNLAIYRTVRNKNLANISRIFACENFVKTPLC
jgi:hypothetical protein